LSKTGTPPGHLSHYHHFHSETRFGLRVLNGFVRRAEGRYITARFVMQPGGKVRALRDLRNHIQQNGVATVTAFGGVGGRTHAVRVLGRRIVLPAGAPELARRTGAELLAASAVRNTDGTFVVYLDPLPRGDRSDALTAASEAFADILERRITEHPDQCSSNLYRRRR
jgi:lauroyl/myristoyl acyltransferase